MDRVQIRVRINDGVYAIPGERSDAPDLNDRREENLHFGARDALEEIRTHYGTDAMMQAWPQVAEFYGLDKDRVLEVWVKHYGPGSVLSATPTSEVKDG